MTHIQVSQETGKVVCNSHLFKNFPQFVVIHTIKGFWIVNETEIGVFLEFPWFFYDPVNVGNVISVSSAFSKPNFYILMLPKAYLTSHSRMSGSRWVTIALWLSGSLRPFWYSFSVYFCHLFLISSLLGPYLFCPLYCPFLQMFPWYL